MWTFLFLLMLTLLCAYKIGYYKSYRMMYKNIYDVLQSCTDFQQCKLDHQWYISRQSNRYYYTRWKLIFIIWIILLAIVSMFFAHFSSTFIGLFVYFPAKSFGKNRCKKDVIDEINEITHKGEYEKMKQLIPKIESLKWFRIKTLRDMLEEFF